MVSVDERELDLRIKKFLDRKLDLVPNTDHQTSIWHFIRRYMAHTNWRLDRVKLVK